MEPVYLDFNATTPMDPRVFEAMHPWFIGPFNSGSRTHSYGQLAKQAVDDARAKIASIVNSEPEDIVFTSGATESNNLAILGLTSLGESAGRKHIISTTIEHKAVLEPLEEMRRRGFNVELVPVTSSGYVEPDEIRRRLRKDTLLVTIMHANNETGVLQPLVEIAELLKGSDILLHTDAAQTFGKEIEDLQNASPNLISISGHKIYGPQGIGALSVKRSANRKRPLTSLIFGGGQERGLRPGTVPVTLAVGLGKAAELALAECKARNDAAAELKHRFLNELSKIDFRVNGDLKRTQSHVINLSFPGVDSEALMMALRDGVAISNGSACTSSLYSPSHVLTALGLSEERISSAVRISWGPTTGSLPATALITAITELRL